MIQTQIRYDPVNPRVERTLKPEAADVFISLQERVLINILGVLFGSGEMEGEPLSLLVHSSLSSGPVRQPQRVLPIHRPALSLCPLLARL